MSSSLWRAILLAAALACAAALRFAVVEPEPLAHLCGSAAAPWWCAARGLVIAAFATNALAIAAVAAGVGATLLRVSGLALAAACLGLAGLVLYSVEAGATAFLLGLLVLARRRETRHQRAA